MPDPRREAFVVFLEAVPQAGEDPLHGHVEPVPSSTRLRFRDREELPAFLAARVAARPRGGGGGGGASDPESRGPGG